MGKLRSNRNKLYDLTESELENVYESLKTTKAYEYLEYVDSKNSDDNILIEKDTKLIIVGSITPSGGKDYYYTSDENKMYEILDLNLDTDMHNNKDNKDYLVNTLKNNKIAFIDIFKKVIRAKNSSQDDHIFFGCIDSELNKYIKKAPSAVIVSNSRLVEKLLKSRNIESKYHTIFSRKNKKDYIDPALLEDWEKFLSSIGMKKK